MLVFALLASCQDPGCYAECADHCRAFPATQVSDDVQPHLREASPGLLCVPDRSISEGGYRPKACAVSWGEGRCLAACLPEVEVMSVFLERDSCGPGELCAPCVSPFTGKPTGACEIGGDHPGDAGTSEGGAP